MRSLLFLSVIFFLLHHTVQAQRPARMDSILDLNKPYYETVTLMRQSLDQKELEDALQKETKDVIKLKLYNALCWEYFISDPQKALQYAQLQMDLAQRLKVQDAIETGLDNFGFLYKNLGEYEQSIRYQLKSLVVKEAKKDTSGISICMNGIGGLYYTMGNFAKALEYFLKGAHFDSLLKSTDNLIDGYGNIGACYDAMGQYDKALKYYLDAEAASKRTGRKVTGDLLQNMGAVSLKKGDLVKAEEYLTMALASGEADNDIRTIVITNISLGDLYAQRKEYEKATGYEEKALSLARQNKLVEFEIQTLRSISNTYACSGNFAKAYEYQNLYANVKDTLLKEQSARAITEMNTKYETEKKEKQIEIQNLTLTQQTLELNKRQIIIYATAGGIFLLLLLSVFIYRSYTEKKNANIILSEKNKIIEEQHKDITDSIHYAERIQKAILPPDQMWFDLLPNSFVLYKPKDILSGDFYWIEQSGDHILFAAADCTGHGVPGALMSIVNTNLLNKAVLEQNLAKPSDILDETNKWLTISLHQSYNESAVRDGMDIALCAIDKNTNRLQFAGAFNGGYIYKKDGTFIDLNGDKKPVGAFIEEKMQTFTNQEFQLEKGDRIFIFSDGYADQFGGPNGKKLKYAKLKQNISESLSMTMPLQKEHLDKKFEEWKGGHEQVDDVLVIGVEV